MSPQNFYEIESFLKVIRKTAKHRESRHEGIEGLPVCCVQGLFDELWIDAFCPNDVAYARKTFRYWLGLKIATTSRFINSFYEFIGTKVFFCGSERCDDSCAAVWPPYFHFPGPSATLSQYSAFQQPEAGL